MSRRLNIPRQIYNEMVAHLRAVYPNEGCGLLSAIVHTVTCHYPIKNIYNSPVKYELDPGQQIEAFHDAERRGETIVAVYHSHPNGPERPSPSDIAQAYYPDLVYIICSLANQDDPTLRGFTIIDQTVAEVALHLV